MLLLSLFLREETWNISVESATVLEDERAGQFAVADAIGGCGEYQRGGGRTATQEDQGGREVEGHPPRRASQTAQVRRGGHREETHKTCRRRMILPPPPAPLCPLFIIVGLGLAIIRA